MSESKQGKLIAGKNHCDRCGQARPVHECAFSFRQTYQHWKALWEARTGRRLTNRRKRRLLANEEEQLDLKALSGIVYWMDLCQPCFAECESAPRPGFPQEFWEAVLRTPIRMTA